MENQTTAAEAPPRKRRLIRKFILILLGLAVPLWYFKVIENRLIFMPSPLPPDSIGWRPTDFPYEDVEFATPDGKTLNGWFVPVDNPRAVLLFCHGNGGSIANRVDMLRQLHELQIATFIFDYRGYGRSTGCPSEAGVQIDGRAARAWLAKRANIKESDIVVFGESIGGAVAVDLAANGGARGMILFHTFGTLREVARFHFPKIAWLMRSRFDSTSKIKNYHGPLMMTHGDADRIVPFKFGKALYEAANKPKVFFTVYGGDHNDPIVPEVWEEVGKFIDRLDDKR